MKKRLPKKILAAFLAAMMVVTSVPFSAITAFAANGYVDVATDEKVQAVETAMKNFQSVLAEDKSYSNVGPAYAAYVACQQGLDAYIYGGESTALDGLADNLNTAVSAMAEFTGIKANTGKYRQVKVYANDDTGYDEATYLKDGYQNVLWLETGINTDNNDGKQSKEDYSSLTLYYPSATLLYDGETTPATSVMAIASGEGSWTWGASDRYISAITLENAKDGINISRNWRGGSSNLDFNWSWYWNGNKYNLSNNTTTAGNVYQIRKGGTVAVYKNYQQYFSNFMEYTGDPGNKYIASFVPTFKGHIGSKNEFATNINDPASPTVPGSTTINVVNYKIVKDAIKAAGNKMKSKDLSTYSMGGLYTYFAAMDDATSFDPNTYFTSTDNSKNDTSGYIKAASGKVQAINAASIDVTNDTKANYQVLRDAMGALARSTYAEGNANNKYYTADSWKTFEDAYVASQTFMAKVNDDEFTNADSVYKSNDEAKVYADALNAAYAGLKTSIAKADTSALVALIQQFESYNSNVFTEATYNAALTAVNKIKTDVWGSVENYGVPTYAPNDDEAGRAKVATAVEEYNAAFAALRISPDAVVLTASGSYSLNQAIDLKKNIKDPTDYSNYATFATALNDAKLAKDNLATTPMTDYDTQYDAYVAAIDTLVKAYNGLRYSFTKIPDGTVFGNGKTNAIERMSILDQGGQYVEGSFTNQGYIFRTKHTPLQVKFGDFNVTFGVLTKQSDAFQLLKNNALDSITINATQPKIAENGSKTHLTSNSNSTPNALSAEQKANYAGCLSYTNQSEDGKDYTYSVSNLRYTGKNNYNDSPHVITLNDGTEVTDYSQAIATNLDTVLGTTDGGSNNPIPGAVFARSNNGKNGGESYITGDFNFTAPATEQQTLTATTYPTSTKYTLGTKFGAVAAWNCRNTLNYCGYNWYTSEMNNQVLNPAVQIVDITPLVELVDLCNTYLPNSNMYTDESWAAFTKALERAQANIDYTNINTTNLLNQLMTTLKQKYTYLWKAKEGLVVKTLNVTFNYKDSTGSDATLVFPVTYGEKLSDAQTNEINAKTVSYVDSKNYTHEFIGFEPAFNPNEAVTADVTYTAKYDEGTPNAAIWTEFNSAKDALIAKLQSSSKFTATALEDVKAAIAELSYFNFTSAQQAEIKANKQNLIDSQKDKMLQLAESLTAIEINDDVAKAVNEAQAAANKNDYDMYDKLGDNFKVTKDVTFDGISTDLTGGTQLTVKGYLYSTQTELDNAIKAALEGLSLKTYDIYVGNNKIGTVPYGTPISVTPTKIISTSDTTAKGDGANYSWTYSFTAPSRDPNFGTTAQDNSKYLTAEKYMITAPSFGFIVKGETHLTATQVNGDKTGYTVTFKSGVNGKIINVINTDASGNFEMPTAPSVPYYTFESYSNDVAPGASATVTKDTVITVNYTADTNNLYTFYVYNTPDDFYNSNVSETWDDDDSGAPTTHNSVAYNQLVTVNIPGAYAIAKGVIDDVTGDYCYYILAYGDSYSFYAHESIGDSNYTSGIVGITEEQYKNYQVPDNEYMMYVYGTDGVRIVAEQDTLTGEYITKDLEFEVYNRETPVFTDDNSKFSLIGTFICPTGYEMVETGFLMTKGTSSLTIENASDSSKGVSRFKASKYTVGNQFVINIKTPSTEQNFKYVAYAKYKDKSGKIVTKYGKTISATTANS